ncbi:MAG: YhdP family protein [Gammaproteobacteria bacterium]
MRRWQHLIWKWLAGVIVAAVLLVATLMGLFRLFAPLVPGYREQTQTWASQALGYPVSIAAMGAQWGLYGPELTLEQVNILSKDHQRVVTTAREIRLGFTLGALLHGQFSRPSRIILIEPQMTLQRDTDGSIGVLGLKGSLNLGREHTDWRQVAADSLAQNAELLIRRGQVTLIDMRTPAAPLVFSDIRLNLDNSADTHQISGRLLLPTVLGQSLSLATTVQGTGAKPEAWQWQTQMQGSALNLPRLLSYWPAYDGRFNSGVVDLRAALSGEGMHVDRVETVIDIHQLIPAVGASANSGFGLLAGTLNWNRSSDGWNLIGSNIQLQRGQDLWPGSRFELHYSHVQGASVSWSGLASFLRLQDLAALAAWLPENLAPDSARWLRFAPSGDVTDLSFQSQWNGKSFDTWSLRGGFSDLGLRADGDIPGFSGLSGELSANQDQGTLQLTGKNVTATFAHLFRVPLTASALTADVHFNHDAQGWHFTIANFSTGNPDVQHVSATGTLLLPADGSAPMIDLQASVENADAHNKSVYFPVGIMPKEVVQWLDSAIVSGQVPSGSLVLRGKLDDFPYDNGRGLFDIRFHLVRGVLDYATNWPRVSGLEADVEFKNQGMHVAVQRGGMLGDDISGATADIADLRQGMLQIQGTARGSAQNSLTFLRSGPLKDRFGHYLDNLKVSGGSDVSLSLSLPVEHVERFKLDGRAQLRDVNITVANLQNWSLRKLNGSVKFSGDGVSADKLSAVFMGEPMRISLAPDGTQDMTQISAEGGASAAELSVALPASFANALSGTVSWKLAGSLPNNPAAGSTGLSLTLTSDLQGLGVALPEPFGKPSDAARPVSATLSFTGDQQMLMRVRFANTLDGLYRFTDENGAWHFERGNLEFGAGEASLPAVPGLMLTGTLPEFFVDDWKPYLPSGSGPVSPSLPLFLQGVNLEVTRFLGFDQDIDHLHVRLARDGDDWKLNLVSTPIAGQISLPLHVDAAHPIVADMQRVTLVRKAAKKQQASPTPQLNPHDVPPLRIAIRQLRYNDVALDNLRADLEPQPQGVTLKSFSVVNPAFTLTASAQWIMPAGGGQQTILNAQLASKDIEKTLQAFGYAPGITGDRGQLQADLSWPAGPLGDMASALEGKLHVKLENGRLLEVKPGAGRIFGLLSINALPRRLLLNFSDVLGKGLAYDSLEGNFTLKDGDAYTSDLNLAGPAAKIQIVGRTGLVKHDFNEAVLVVPSVGPTLPILGALAGGLGVGAVVFVLSEIFRKPISEAGEIRYHLTGTWDNPVLTKVVPPKPASSTPR